MVWHRPGRAAMLLVPLLLTAGTLAPGAPGPRYYVVGGDAAHPEYLFQIAAGTLGDGRRYPEIFELNRQRLQPDGTRLTDPAALRPGWILLLPDDAHGPGVRTGPPPPIDRSSGLAVSPPAAIAEPVPGGGPQWPLRAGAALLAAVLLSVALLLARRRSPVQEPGAG